MCLIALYAAARVEQASPNHIPMLAIIAPHVFVPLLFAIIHGTLAYGVRGFLVFLACASRSETLLRTSASRPAFLLGIITSPM